MLAARLAALARARRPVCTSLSGVRWSGVACGTPWRTRSGAVETVRVAQLCTVADEPAPKRRRRSYRDLAKQGGGVAATRRKYVLYSRPSRPVRGVVRRETAM